MPDLVTLEEYKEALSITTEADDDKHETAIAAAEQAVTNYTSRDFLKADPSVGERKFWLEPGSSFLEIDDCTEVTDVSGLGIATWEERSEGPAAAHGVYTYIQLEASYQTSVEMGFERNEDIFGTQQASTLGTEVTVTADWGWGSVPENVKRAIVWTAASFEVDTDNPYGALSSKSVAEVSETYYIPPAMPSPTAVPANAQALLEPYRRVNM